MNREVYNTILARRSIRSFTEQKVSREDVRTLLEAGMAAPSACNLQPFSFKLIRNPEMKNAIAKCCRQDFPAEAPAILAVVSDPESAWKRGDGFNSADTDMAIAMEHAMLAATAEGLGCCWICAFDPEKAAGVLNVEPPLRISALCPLGFPAAPPREFVRKAESLIFEVID